MTQINHYVMWGVKLPAPKGGADAVYEILEAYLDSAWNYEFNPKNGITALWGDDYLCVGHVVAKSGNYEALELVELCKRPADWPSLEEAIWQVCDALEIASEDRPDCRWIVLGHYR